MKPLCKQQNAETYDWISLHTPAGCLKGELCGIPRSEKSVITGGITPSGSRQQQESAGCLDDDLSAVTNAWQALQDCGLFCAELDLTGHKP